MKIIFALLLCAWVAPSRACDYPDFYLAEANWVMEEPFTLECLTKSAAVDSAAFTRTADAIKKKYPNVYLAVQILPIRVDVEERKNSDRAPITRVMTGSHGKTSTVVRFEKSLPTEAQLDSVFSSPAKARIIKELLKNKIVLLVLNGKDKNLNKAFLKCAEKGSKMAKDMVKKNCSILQSDLADPAEKYLYSNIFGASAFKEGILVIFGKGKGLHLITDPLAPQLVLDVCQMLDNNTNTNSSDLQPRILLNMPMPPLKK